MTMVRFLNYFLFLCLSIMAKHSVAEEATITGSAFYLERIALPANALFEASLEDVSLMDVPSIQLGKVVINPVGSVPIHFSIHYNSDEIKQGHRYNVRGKIIVDGRLMFITDTAYPVLMETPQAELKLKMKLLPSYSIK